MFSEFIQMWQTYVIAIDNDDCALQVNHDKSCGQCKIISLKKLNELKHSTMLEF